jgi:hypothetical protein
MIGFMSGPNKGNNNNPQKKPINDKQAEEKKEIQSEKLDELIPLNNKKKSNNKKTNSIQLLKEQIISDRKSKEFLKNNHEQFDSEELKKPIIQSQTRETKKIEERQKVPPEKVLNKKRKAEEPLEHKSDKKEPSIKIKIPLLKEEEPSNTINDIDLTNEDNTKLPESKRVEIMQMKLKEAEENKRLSMQKLNINFLDLNKFKKKN